MNGLNSAKRAEIPSLLVEGSSMRSISRVEDDSINLHSAVGVRNTPYLPGF